VQAALVALQLEVLVQVVLVMERMVLTHNLAHLLLLLAEAAVVLVIAIMD
jgi:hypothetical protein